MSPVAVTNKSYLTVSTAKMRARSEAVRTDAVPLVEIIPLFSVRVELTGSCENRKLASTRALRWMLASSDPVEITPEDTGLSSIL
jgi:hypothetical protein